MVAGGASGGTLPILLFPQLAASGWLLRTRTAFFHAALATLVPARPRRVARCSRARSTGTQTVQTGLIGFGFFATVGVAVALGRYTKASEELAAQRGIDVANLEQVNRLIIQDMQDGVLVVDLNGVVRGHNAQVTRLLGGFGRMRGGMRLAEFSRHAARLLAALAGGLRRAAAAVQGRGDAAAAARAPRAHRLRAERRHAHLPRGPRPRADRGAADEARGDGPAHGVDRARGAQSAVGDQPGGATARGGRRRRAPKAQRLLDMIRNNAKRIDRIVGEVLQLNRRDRQQPEVIALAEFMRSLTDEIVQAENMPPGGVVMQVPTDLLVIFDRGHLNQIVWNLVRNAWQHCQKKEGSIRIAARAGYMGDAVICELADDGPGIPAELRGADLRAVLHDAPGRHRPRPVHRARAGRRQRRRARAAAARARAPISGIDD